MRNALTRWQAIVTTAITIAVVFASGILGEAIALAATPAYTGHLTSTALIAQFEPAPSSAYEYRDRHSPDGIGKFYMGREIAEVMGHRGAAWLERPSREWEERPQQLMDALKLNPTDRVADLGAGTGYFTFRLASRVPQGEVLAVDIQPEMLDIINFLKEDNQALNVKTILAREADPHLPAGIDLVLMVDAYHEFEYPQEVMTAVVEALKPGGKVVLAEYRGENPFIPIKRLHKMTQRQVRREMRAVGLQWVKTESFLPQQHLMTFEKPPL